MQVSFTGDLSFTGIFQDALLNDDLEISNEIQKLFKKSDFTVVNLEGVATDRNAIYDKSINVTSPLKSVRYLKDIGVNVFNLANNHTFDAGLEGFRECKKEILKRDCLYFGAGEEIQEATKTLTLEKNDISISLVGVGDAGSSKKIAKDDSEGVFSDMNITKIKEKISEARKNSDWVIVNFHNGTEYNFYPVPYVQEKLKRFIDFGADIVIGHHPHVPQGIEKYNKGLIFYSLGNFIFDLEPHKMKKNSDLSMIATLNFHKDSFDYKYILTRNYHKNKSVAIVSDSKTLKEYEAINLKTNSPNMNYYRFVDTLREIFINPIWFGKKLSNVLLPITIPLKVKGYTKGNSRELLRVVLDYLKIGFLMKMISGEDALSRKNEY